MAACTSKKAMFLQNEAHDIGGAHGEMDK